MKFLEEKQAFDTRKYCGKVPDTLSFVATSLIKIKCEKVALPTKDDLFHIHKIYKNQNAQHNGKPSW